MILICYDRCSTCKKAEKWLNEHDLTFTKRPIKEQRPSEDELKDWHARSGLPLSRFFNTSGQLYRDMKLKDKVPMLSDEELLSLLASDGMLVKRPVLVTEKAVLVGFSEKAWTEALL